MFVRLGIASFLLSFSSVVLAESPIQADITPQTEPAIISVSPAQKPFGSILPPVSVLDEDSKGPVGAVNKILVKDIRIQGNKVFGHELLAGITQPYINRELEFTDLQELSDRLTALYRSNGYVNSGVIVPVQTVTDNIVELQVIEGRLSDVVIETDGRFDAAHIEKRLRLHSIPAVNVYAIEEQLQLLQQDPRIDTVAARLQPGSRPGEAILEADIKEKPAINIGLELNNHASPNVGAEGLVLYASHNNLTGSGNQLAANMTKTEGLSQFGLNYVQPLTATGSLFEFNYHHSENKVVHDAFADLDIEGLLNTIGLGYSSPIVQTLYNNLSWSADLDVRHSESYLLGEPFSFSEGSDNGEIDINVLRFGIEWRRQSRFQVLATRLSLSKGLSLQEEDDDDDDEVAGPVLQEETNVPENDFMSLLGQVQLVRKMDFLRSNIRFRFDFQLADSPLYSMEQFSIGGHATVRGYRENLSLGDNGILASVEYRIPFVGRSQDALSVAIFSDLGRAWNTDRNNQADNKLASVGLGVVGKLSDNVGLRLYLAKALQEIGVQGEEDLQDKGFHFSINSFWQLGK